VVKKLAILGIVSLYLILSIGIARSTHFCMGREQTPSFFSFESKKCPCFRLTQKSKSCCEDEHELIKIENDQSASQVLLTPIPSFNLISELLFDEMNSFTSLSAFQFIDVRNLPPPKVPIYQSICSLVFYESVV
jgi:hypothetical protein